MCFFQRGTSHLSGDLVVGTQLTANLGAGQDILTVLVELELGDDDVGRVEAQGDGLARGLVTGDTLNVDNVFETVNGGDLALAALVGATDNGDLVVLADGNAADLYSRVSETCFFSDLFGVARWMERTLYFSRSSLLRGALMMTRRWLEGALK